MTNQQKTYTGNNKKKQDIYYDTGRDIHYGDKAYVVLVDGELVYFEDKLIYTDYLENHSKQIKKNIKE